MSKRKLITGGTLFLAALAAGVFLLLPALRRPVTTWTLPDGSTLRLLKVTAGTNHAFNYGQKLKDYLYPVVPAAYRSNFNFQIAGVSSAPDESLVLWFAHNSMQLDPGTMLPNYALSGQMGTKGQSTKIPVLSRVIGSGNRAQCPFFATVFDAAGNESAPAPAVGMVPLPDGTELYSVVLTQYPRRAQSLDLRLQVLPDVSKPAAEFRMTNPARREPANWAAEPLPATRRTNGLEIKLTGWTTESVAPATAGSPPGGWHTTYVYATLEVLEQGEPATNWMVSHAILSNAAGESCRRDYADAPENARFPRKLLLIHPLWTDEPAWKIMVQLKRLPASATPGSLPASNSCAVEFTVKPAVH